LEIESDKLGSKLDSEVKKFSKVGW
jgi:hypothetical protein